MCKSRLIYEGIIKKHNQNFNFNIPSLIHPFVMKWSEMHEDVEIN